MTNHFKEEHTDLQSKHRNHIRNLERTEGLWSICPKGECLGLESNSHNFHTHRLTSDAVLNKGKKVFF